MDLLRPIRKFDQLQQKHTVLAVPAATIKKFMDDDASTFAVAVAFYAFLAVFPLLLLFVTILGYVLSGDRSLMDSVRDSVLGNFPVIGTALERHRLKGSALALVAGVALLLWSSLNVTGRVTNAFDHVWDVPRHERHNFVQKKLRGLLLISVLGVLFVIASGASGVVSGGLGGPALKAFGIIVSILVNVGVFLAAFRFLSSEPPEWRDLMPGAIVAAFLWEALQLLGGVYINHIKHSESAYGTFALVLGILAWLHLGAQMTVYCAEFNTVLAKRAWPRALLGGPYRGIGDPGRITDS
jgi:YihY family inner membrane protein